MQTAKGSFEVLSWDEDAYEDRGDGVKLTRASVSQRFEGDVAGDGAVQWLMAYGTEGTARFLGFQKVDGTIGDRHGSFILETSGAFDGQTATWDASVVPGSANGQLGGLTGRGWFSAPLGSRATFELEYDLA